MHTLYFVKVQDVSEKVTAAIPEWWETSFTTIFWQLNGAITPMNH